MQELMDLLNSLIEKYNIEQADVAAIQEAVANVEGSGDDEFGYEEDVDISEEPVEEE